MSAEEQVIRLVLETKGRETIEALAKSTSNYKALLEESVKAFAKGEISAEQFTAAQAKLGGEFGRQAALLEKLQAAQRGEAAAAGAVATAALRVGDAVDKAGGKMAGFGQAGMQAGRVIQDFAQGGIGGILNNIEGLSVALGGGAGLAGILTLLGVAVFAFKDKVKAAFDTVMGEAVTAGVGHVERLQRRIKELEEKPTKLAIDTLELENANREAERLKGALEWVRNLKKDQAYFEKESGRAIAETFAEEGPGGKAGVLGDLVRGMTKEMADQSGPLAEARKEMAKLHGQIQMTEISGPGAFPEGDTKEAAIARLQKELAAAREKANTAFRDVETAAAAEVKETYETATGGTGPAQLAAQEKLQRFLQTRGFGGLAGSVGAASPAATQAQEETDTAFEAHLERVRAADAGRKEKAKDREKAAKEFYDDLGKTAVADATAEGKGAAAEGRERAKVSAAGVADAAAEAKRVAGAVSASTPLDEGAALAAARMMAQGADEQTIRERVGNEVRRQLQGMGVGGLQGMNVAGAITNEAMGTARDALDKATIGMGRAGLSKDEQAQAAMAASAGAIEDLAAKYAANQQAWAGFAARMNAVRAQIRGR